MLNSNLFGRLALTQSWGPDPGLYVEGEVGPRAVCSVLISQTALAPGCAWQEEVIPQVMPGKKMQVHPPHSQLASSFPPVAWIIQRSQNPPVFDRLQALISLLEAVLK